MKNKKIKLIGNTIKPLGLTLVETLISIAILSFMVSIIVLIVIDISKQYKRNSELADNLRLAVILGQKIKNSLVMNKINLIDDIPKDKYVIIANKGGDQKLAEFHLYKNSQGFDFVYYYFTYYQANGDSRVYKYKIPKQVSFEIISSSEFYEIYFYVKDRYSKTDNKKIAYYMVFYK